MLVDFLLLFAFLLFFLLLLFEFLGFSSTIVMGKECVCPSLHFMCVCGVYVRNSVGSSSNGLLA